MADLDPDDPRLDDRLDAIRAGAAYVAEDIDQLDGPPGLKSILQRVTEEDVPALLWLVARLRARLRARRDDGSGT